MNMSTLYSIKYMNRSFFSKTRYMIGVGFKKLGRHVKTLAFSNQEARNVRKTLLFTLRTLVKRWY